MAEVASVEHHVFPNGLVLVSETMPSVRSAAFTLHIPAGAIYDPESKPGSASMLAEWVMRGAGNRDSRELVDTLDDLGVSHGESAYTSHTGMSAATLGENLIPALEIFADVLRRPHLDEEEVEPIRALSLQSLQGLEDDPSSKVIHELRKRHYPDPWGRCSAGSVEGVQSIRPSDLKSFFQRFYRPDGAILAVAGAVDWSRLLDAVGRLLGDWTSQPDPVVKLRPGGPKRDHIVKETQQTQIALAHPTAKVTDPDYYLARAATAILGGYSSARLFTEVREKRGLCYSVYSSYESQKDRAAVVYHAGTSNDRAQETLDVTLAEIARMSERGVDREELDTMRAGLKSSLIMQQESSMSRSAALASDWFHLGRVRPLAEIAGALDALTPEAVSDFARRQPSTSADLTILTLGPKSLNLPAEA